MNDTQASHPEAGDQSATDAQRSTPSPVLDLIAAKLTDVGRTRPRNEDYVECQVPSDPEQLEQKGSIYLVADGMGGHQAGEVASRSAAESVIKHYYHDTSPDIGVSLVRAVRLANQEIYALAQADESMSGMGTTLVAAVVLGSKVYIANVGDSRAYLINAGGMVQITEDHSWVEEQVRAGLLTPEQAKRHPQRNLVTRALGSKPAVDVDLFMGEIGLGDSLLLCSDGLTGRVEDPEISSVVQTQHPQEAVQTLVNLANERGGNDNVSVLIVSTQKDLPPARAPVAAPAARQEARRSLLVPLLVGAAAVLLLAIGGLLAARYLFPAEPKATPTAPTAISPATATLAPRVTSSDEALTAPTATLSPTPAEENREPTATLAPTATSTPQPSPTRPVIPPTATEPPTPTAIPTTSPPVLLEPVSGEEVAGRVTFTWQWVSGQLPEGYAFDLRIWSPAEGRQTARGADEPTRQSLLDVELQFVPAIRDFGAGAYNWAVVVVWIPCGSTAEECQPQLVSEWSETRTLIYTGGPEPTP